MLFVSSDYGISDSAAASRIGLASSIDQCFLDIAVSDLQISLVELSVAFINFFALHCLPPKRTDTIFIIAAGSLQSKLLSKTSRLDNWNIKI